MQSGFPLNILFFFIQKKLTEHKLGNKVNPPTSLPSKREISQTSHVICEIMDGLTAVLIAEEKAARSESSKHWLDAKGDRERIPGAKAHEHTHGCKQESEPLSSNEWSPCGAN
jgi:hypothetical protein